MIPIVQDLRNLAVHLRAMTDEQITSFIYSKPVQLLIRIARELNDGDCRYAVCLIEEEVERRGLGVDSTVRKVDIVLIKSENNNNE